MCGEFFIARGDATKMFELIEAPFDQVARLVAMTVIVAGVLAVRARRNDGFGLLGLDPFDQGVRVVAFVRDHRAGPRRLVEQCWGLADVGLLGPGEGKADGVAQRIDDAVDFGSKAAPRTSQSLRAVFFLAPAACW